MIVKFKGFIQRTKVYRVRKDKFDISIHLGLTKRRYDLLKKARTRIKDFVNVEYTFKDINCFLGFRDFA